MSNLKLSQGLEVLRPKADKALPIPCNEWDVLKEKIDALTTEPWFFHTSGSTLIGAALATLISIWTGAVAPTPEKNIVIAWAVSVVCSLVGIACLLFACAFHATWTVIPPGTGRPFHAQLDSSRVASGW